MNKPVIDINKTYIVRYKDQTYKECMDVLQGSSESHVRKIWRDLNPGCIFVGISKIQAYNSNT